MGRLLIRFSDNRLESFKCKSKERASEIVKKRKNIIKWDFFNDGERLPNPKIVVEQRMPQSFEELDRMIKTGKF